MTHGGSQDERFMAEALAEAARARGQTRPNPMVGAVVVRDGVIVGRGFHERAGADHAEVAALRDAGDAAGADVFVNLEPCSHYGRTPPCADALIAAGVRRVVAATIDPNPQVSGRGLERLRAAGIAVEVGVLEDAARRLNEGFFVHMLRRRPFVTLKLATSLDGRIATRTGDSQWITSSESRRRVHDLRADHDAILIGNGTLLADNPRLTARDAGDEPRASQPHRYAIDTRLAIPDGANLLKIEQAPTTLICADDVDPQRLAELKALGLGFCLSSKDDDGHLPLPELLLELGRRGHQRLLVEGGGALAGALMDSDLVDRIELFMAPIIIGGRDAVPAFGGRGIERVAEARAFVSTTTESIVDDLHMRLELRRPGGFDAE